MSTINNYFNVKKNVLTPHLIKQEAYSCFSSVQRVGGGDMTVAAELSIEKLELSHFIQFIT